MFLLLEKMPERTTNVLKYADIHLHSTLRPFAEWTVNPNANEAKITYQKLPSENCPNGRTKTYIQSDFTSLRQGGVKVAFTAMYPIEQGWFDLLEALGIDDEDKMQTLLDSHQKDTSNKDLEYTELQKSLSTFGIASKLIDQIIEILGFLITFLPKRYIKQIMSPDYKYFDYLIKELNYLQNQCSQSSVPAQIPKNNDDLIKLLNDPSKMVVIPTIEGAAALVSGNAQNIRNGEIQYSDIEKNAIYVKNSTSVFFVTLSHHFYNSLIGHAQSVYGSSRIAIDQMYGKGNIISADGQKLIELLLSINSYKNAGRRILIDIKHLSLAARIQYCKLISDYNIANPNDQIPIISSHSAFAGVDNISEIGLFKGDYSYYEVNIATQEVVAIYNSKGLIGLNFDKNVLSHKPHELSRKEIESWTKEQWAQLFVDNLLGMVEAAKKIVPNLNATIWDIFAMGSDFDGFINPVNCFPTAASFPFLEPVLVKLLDSSSKFKQLSFGISAQDVVSKFMGQNAINFLKKHYNSNSNSQISK